MKKKKGDVWQCHHVCYDPERVVIVTRAEHYYLTCISRFKALSKAFREAITILMKEKPIKEKE